MQRSVYGPGGSYPLLPGPQPPAAPGMLRITSVTAPGGTSKAGGAVVQITNPSTTDAIDMSDWALQGDTLSFAFAPGAGGWSCAPLGVAGHAKKDLVLPLSHLAPCVLHPYNTPPPCTLTIPHVAGTVLPANTTLHVAQDVAAYRAANAGKGLFMVGPLVVGKAAGAAPAAGASVSLIGEDGSTVVAEGRSAGGP